MMPLSATSKRSFNGDDWEEHFYHLVTCINYERVQNFFEGRPTHWNEAAKHVLVSCLLVLDRAREFVYACTLARQLKHRFALFLFVGIVMFRCLFTRLTGVIRCQWFRSGVPIG